MRTEHLDQASFCPFAPREVSVLAELALGHLRYSLTDVPPQSNSPPGSVLEPDHAGVVRRRALPPRRHSARLERNTVRPPIKSTAHRFRPTDPPGPRWSICYYHQDLHRRRLQAGSRPDPSALSAAHVLLVTA
ncbi:unnamed protein product [Parnassius mnemosyne]|uniref:Uncharacterized protein n=1 Tax=Parnassius mnemosyne TaxID=213953 RepID=A0AAV1KJJ2_9NEOP